MSEPECPDHPHLTVPGVIGDFYCLDPECQWWDVSEEDDDE